MELVDGGTWGMNLLPLIEGPSQLVLIDAIRSGRAAGTPGGAWNGSSCPATSTHKLSPHQIDLREVLALAELRGTLPAATVAIGIEPAAIELGTALSPAVEERLDAAAAAVAERLLGLGAPVPAAGWAAHA